MMANSRIRKPAQRISLLGSIKEIQCHRKMPLQARSRSSQERAGESASRSRSAWGEWARASRFADGTMRSSIHRRPFFAAKESRRLPFPRTSRARTRFPRWFRTQQELGPTDILVNNARTAAIGPFHEFWEAEWDKVVDTNLKSVFLVSRAVAPEMIRRQTGHIINISSLAGKSTFATGSIYCASKWGLMGLTGAMAEDLRAWGIRVSAICPGSVATEFSGQGHKDSSKALQPEDVAHAVAALVTQAPGSFMSEVHIRPTRKP